MSREKNSSSWQGVRVNRVNYIRQLADSKWMESRVRTKGNWTEFELAGSSSELS